MALFAAAPAFAFDPFVVKDIRVEGIQRTEAGTAPLIICRCGVGETFSEQQAADAIRALFATGFFSDVRIETEGDVLVVAVDERPAIADIAFVGVKELTRTRSRPAQARSASPSRASSTVRCSSAPSRNSSASTRRAASMPPPSPP